MSSESVGRDNATGPDRSQPDELQPSLMDVATGVTRTGLLLPSFGGSEQKWVTGPDPVATWLVVRGSSRPGDG